MVYMCIVGMHDIGFLQVWYADINKLITMYTNINTDIFLSREQGTYLLT